MIKNKGSGLENFVAELYKDLGYINVRQDVRFSKSRGAPIEAQIDLTYNYLGVTRYVECKFHKNRNVTLDEMSRFYTVLQLLNIQPYLGEIVTNKNFDPRCINLSKSSGIKIINGEDLSRLEKLRKNGLRKIFLGYRVIERFNDDGVSGALDYINTRFKSINSQIKHYTK